jgi:hypothetical protein
MMGSVRTLAAAFAALALSIGAAASAQVPDPFARELAQRLTRAETAVTNDGFMLAAGPFAGALPQRMARQININLRAGQEYRFVGVCDARCTDIDLRVLDPSGQVVAEDSADDDTPIVHVRATVTGAHRVEVAMYNCAADQCWYAFNVYSR